MTATTPRPKAPKGALITGVVLLFLSLAGCGVGCAGFLSIASELTDAVDAAESTPLNQPTTLAATSELGVILTSSSSARCYVEDSSGTEVRLEEPGAGTSGSVELNGESLDFQYSFDTDEGETYNVVCGDEAGTLTGSYVVAPFPGFGGIFAGLGGIGAGILFFIVGVIFLIVGLVKRSKWKKNQAMAPAAYGAAPMPGSVPPPPGAPGAVPPPPGGAAPPPPAAPTPPPGPATPPPPSTPPPPPGGPGTPPPPPPPPGQG